MAKIRVKKQVEKHDFRAWMVGLPVDLLIGPPIVALRLIR